MSVTITRVLEWCFSSVIRSDVRNVACYGGRVNYEIGPPCAFSNCQKVFCLRGARHDIATYINPEQYCAEFASRTGMQRVRSQNKSDISGSNYPIDPEHGSTRRGERLIKYTTRDKCGSCLTVLPLGHLPDLNEESTFRHPCQSPQAFSRPN